MSDLQTELAGIASTVSIPTLSGEYRYGHRAQIPWELHAGVLSTGDWEATSSAKEVHFYDRHL
jgi:hypothetical protein